MLKKWLLGGLLVLIGFSAKAQKIKSMRVTSVPLSATSITRVSCSEFDRYFDVRLRKNVLLKMSSVRKDLKALLPLFKPLRLKGIDVRGKLIISYYGKGNKIICFDEFGHFSKNGAFFENLDLFNFLLRNGFITEGL